MRINSAIILLLGALAAFASALPIDAAVGTHGALAVLGVVLAMSFGRAERRAGLRTRLVSLAAIPAVALGAGAVGALLRTVPPLGAALFVAGLAGAIWLRRFGPRGALAGRLLTLPLIAMLVVPVPVLVPPGRPPWTVALGAAVVALLAAAWATALPLAATRLRRPPHEPHEPHGPALGVPEPAPVTRASTLRPIPSTRLAVQMAVALAAAFLLGHLVSPAHGTWAVLTAFLVGSGNRGRGDVVWKGVLRLAGAAGGTLAATLLGQAFAPGDPLAIAAIFALLGVAAWLREYSYAYWAAGVTGALAILYAYYGEAGPAALGARLIGILVGAILAVGAAWFVLPIRTSDVARRRTADALAALSDLLPALHTDRPAVLAAHARFHQAVEGLNQLAPPLRALRATKAGPAALADAIDALNACAAPLETLLDAPPGLFGRAPLRRDVGAARSSIGGVRRTLAGRPEPDATATPPRDPSRTDSPAETCRESAALAALGAHLETVRVVWSRSPRRRTP
ncbi:FUSC family protein [Cryptosporangium sp. NPDC051539]|uniref:FUSC family protein n=1 Tax=Cryptosporangium sp. NPDC051539 TaxID=3363962 RepID=UPI00379A8347